MDNRIKKHFRGICFHFDLKLETFPAGIEILVQSQCPYIHVFLFNLSKIKQREIIYGPKQIIKRSAMTFTLTWFKVTAHH